jgi:hypothetical protein
MLLKGRDCIFENGRHEPQFGLKLESVLKGLAIVSYLLYFSFQTLFLASIFFSDHIAVKRANRVPSFACRTMRTLSGSRCDRALHPHCRAALCLCYLSKSRYDFSILGFQEVVFLLAELFRSFRREHNKPPREVNAEKQLYRLELELIKHDFKSLKPRPVKLVRNIPLDTSNGDNDNDSRT